MDAERQRAGKFKNGADVDGWGQEMDVSGVRVAAVRSREAPLAVSPKGTRGWRDLFRRGMASS